MASVTDAGLTAVGSRELSLRPAGLERQQLLRVLVALRILLTGGGVIVATLFATASGTTGRWWQERCSWDSVPCS